MSSRQRWQTGTLEHGKATPPSKEQGLGVGGRGSGGSGKDTKAKKTGAGDGGLNTGARGLKTGIRDQGLGVREKQDRARIGTPAPDPQPPTPLLGLIETYLSSQGLGERTKRSYRDRLGLFAAFLDPGGILAPREITKAHINAYAVSLEDKSEATRAAYLKTLKLFLSRLTEENILLTHPAAHLTFPNLRPLLPVPLSEREMMRLLNAPDTDTHLGLRDRAILEVLYSTGMRLGELLALTLQDVDFSERQCFIRKGKGGKGRWAPLTHEACTFLQAYLDTARPRLVKARPYPQIFVGLRGRPLDRDGVRALCRLHARNAGITRRVWPHLLRHTAACHLLAGGASLFHVQLLLGHALPVTTQRYTAVTPGLMRSTLQACHPRA